MRAPRLQFSLSAVFSLMVVFGAFAFMCMGIEFPSNTNNRNGAKCEVTLSMLYEGLAENRGASDTRWLLTESSLCRCPASGRFYLFADAKAIKHELGSTSPLTVLACDRPRCHMNRNFWGHVRSEHETVHLLLSDGTVVLLYKVPSPAYRAWADNFLLGQRSADTLKPLGWKP